MSLVTRHASLVTRQWPAGVNSANAPVRHTPGYLHGRILRLARVCACARFTCARFRLQRVLCECCAASDPKQNPKQHPTTDSGTTCCSRSHRRRCACLPRSVSGSTSLLVCVCLYVSACMSLLVCLCLYVSACMSLLVCPCLYVSACKCLHVSHSFHLSLFPSLSAAAPRG